MTPDHQTTASHTRETSPRRRRSLGGRISISWKLFCYLILFTAFILAVVWFMQIGLLDYFYSQSKTKELSTADRLVTESILEEPASLDRTVEQCASSFQFCIRVFIVDGPTAHQIVNAQMSGDCLIHHISDTYLTYLYNRAIENGGLYEQRISSEILYKNNPDALEEGGLNASSPDTEAHESLETDKILNLVHARVITGEQGEHYLLLFNSELQPLNATVETLKTQFWMIAFILLWAAFLLAILLSRGISAPIKKMSGAAARMAKGRYDVDFTADGFKEVVELSDALTNASEQLAANDRLQKELIANISHDLRTPLTMIIGYSEVMRDLPGENTPENVQVIIDETERLSRLVNDLLDLSKLQAGSRVPTMEVFNLTELMEATMLRYEKLTQKDGYRVEYASDVSVDVLADRTMILQVLYNLINNAINYTGEDKLVRVTQRLTEDGTRVRISVTDSGVGIAPDQIPLIWDRYYKIDKVHRRAMIGTGLGLSIVKQILEAHRTIYGVESKLGEGSTFWFDMRVEAIVTDDMTEEPEFEDADFSDTTGLPPH